MINVNAVLETYEKLQECRLLWGKKGLERLISGILNHILPDPLSTGISTATVQLADVSKIARIKHEVRGR